MIDEEGLHEVADDSKIRQQYGELLQTVEERVLSHAYAMPLAKLKQKVDKLLPGAAKLDKALEDLTKITNIAAMVVPTKADPKETT